MHVRALAMDSDLDGRDTRRAPAENLVSESTERDVIVQAVLNFLCFRRRSGLKTVIVQLRLDFLMPFTDRFLAGACRDT